MQKVSSKDREAHLNAIETIRDFVRKANSNVANLIMGVEQDDNGATLVLHVHSQKGSEVAAIGALSDRLVAFASSLVPLAEAAAATEPEPQAAAAAAPVAVDPPQQVRRGRRKKSEESVAPEQTGEGVAAESNSPVGESVDHEQADGQPGTAPRIE